MDNNKPRKFYFLLKFCLLVVIISISMLAGESEQVKADDDGHSHFRYGHIYWEQVGSDYNARITFTAGFRRSGFICRNPLSGAAIACSEPDGRPGIGDYFLETIGATRINDFGDGTSTDVLYFRVFAVNKQDDWLMARALDPGTLLESIFHSYNSVGPFTLYTASCCRITLFNATNVHINNPGLPYRVEAVINFTRSVPDIPAASPVSLLPPIVDCLPDTVCRFTIATIDPDAVNPQFPQLQMRLSSSVEMGGPSLMQPPKSEIRAKEDGTFEYVWDTNNVTRGPEGSNTLYSTQVVITDIKGTKSVLDFFLRLKELPGPEGITLVPVRWCGLKGSPSMVDPNDVNDVLLGRLRRMNSDIYFRQAAMSFFSGALLGNIPVIEVDDPNGHILSPRISENYTELYRALNKCRLEWQYSDPAAKGLIALSINRFVDSARNPVGHTLGWAGLPLRFDPPDPGQQILHGWASVIDPDYLDELPGDDRDTHEKWLGHEVGHSLSLRHNYIDLNLMDDTKALEATKLQPDQVGFVRSQAVLVPGSFSLPSSIALASPITLTESTAYLSGTFTDVLDDTPAEEAFLDIETFGLSIDKNLDLAYLFVSTFGLFTDNISGLNYVFAADIDNDPTTGGMPSDIGIPNGAQGIDAIGIVEVDVADGIPQGTPTVWIFQNGEFSQVSDPNIMVDIGTLDTIAAPATQIGDEMIPMGQTIQLTVPTSVWGQVTSDIRAVFVAENLNTGSVDSIEGPIILISPSYPACQVEPAGTLLGSSVTVIANGLPANSSVDVFLGTLQVETGTTDSAGNTSIEFTIPIDVSTGGQPVSVKVAEAALEANCGVNLYAAPAFDEPPSPVSGSNMTVNVGDEIVFQIQASDADVGDVVTLDIIGLPLGASFPLPLPANPVASTFTWTPGPEDTGVYVLVFVATDSTGLSSPPHSLTIKVIEANQPPLLAVPGEQSVQYSDLISFIVSATDPDNPLDTLLFSVTGLPSGLVLMDNGDGTATVSGIVQAAPGVYNVQFTVSDPGGLTDIETVPIVVSKEDARVTYTGPMMVSTSCANCTEATVPLRATILDITAIPGDSAYDPDAGDITNATVSFVNRDNANTVLCTANVVFFDLSQSTAGTATCDWVVNIGNSNGIDYTVGIVVNGHYIRNSSEDDTVVVVSKPSTNFITGGGYLINQNSAGTYSGDAGLKTNFGFSIKFNKKGTNLIGRMTIIVRQSGRVYQIKTNALSSIVAVPYNETNPNSGTAEFFGKANVQDVTDPLNPISLEGNATLQVTMKDNGEPGNTDTLGISLWSKTGKLLFSSNWNGVKTIEQLLDGGNLQVK